MKAVMGIDAAWTNKNASGVSLITYSNGEWSLVAVESSYENFHNLISSSPQRTDSEPCLLLETARKLCGTSIDIVAVDMPMSRMPITGRRPCDNAVAKAYSRKKAGTHSPNSERPGKVGKALHHGFEQCRYSLCTQSIAIPALIEVYPHPALIVLMQADERIPYKKDKIRKYWPGLSIQERRVNLFRAWSDIINKLDYEISDVCKSMPLPDICLDQEKLKPGEGIKLKEFEDKIDSIICAWAGIKALENSACPFGGDENAAIWIPR